MALSELFVYAVFIISNAKLFTDSSAYEDYNEKYFPTIERISSNPIRLLAKFLYIVGFGRLIQTFFMFNSTHDQDYVNHMCVRYWCVYNDVFHWYCPTFLVGCITVYIDVQSGVFADQGFYRLLMTISIFVCFIKNLIHFLVLQSYLELRRFSLFLVFS